ncbi:MAG: hypothetical protein Q8Q23_06265 [bacterium]|nr:hypothetical protein [bacterium]
MTTQEQKNKADFKSRDITGERDKDFAELLSEREKENIIDRSLKEIYSSENSKSDDGMPKNSTPLIQRRKLDPWKRISITFVFLLIVITAVSWYVFFLFHAGSRLNTDDITFHIVGPQEVVAGQEVVYELQFKNLSNFNLQDIEINLIHGDNFIVIDSVPEVIERGATWKLDSLATKRSGRLEIKAKLIGEIDSEYDLNAIISYRPENFSSSFSSEANYRVKVLSTGINLEILSPSFYNINDDTAINIDYVAEKDNFIPSFNVRLEHGESFSMNGESEIKVENITDQKQTIKLGGKYTKQPSADEGLKLVFFVPAENSVDENLPEVNSEIEIKTIEHIFAKYDVSAPVAEGALLLNLTVNGSDSGKPVSLGDTLNYVVHYKNNSEAELKNVVIIAIIDSPLVDWSTLKDSNKGEKRGNAIIWTKSEIRGLAEVGPDDEDSLSFSIGLKDIEAAKDISSSNFSVTSSLDYSIDGKIKDSYKPVFSSTNKVNTDLILKNEARYFDHNNIAVGSGPLPPKVGEKTSYNVYWTINNTRHNLKNIKVITSLPANINWENTFSRSVGKIIYNSDSREVEWSFDGMDAFAEPPFSVFTISLTPQESEKNKILTILNATKITAIDSETNGVITLETNSKTTNLDDDKIGKGYGKVEE